jgi:HEAT repeat protein
MDPRRELLVQMLKDPDEEVRQNAADALEHLEGLANFEALLEHYRSGDKVKRLRAIYAFGKLNAEECLPPLIHALEEEAEDIRAAAVRVLGETANPQVLPALVLRLQDPSLTIQTMAVEALGNFRSIQIIPRLIPLLQRDNKYLVIATLLTLAKLNAREALDTILILARNQDPDIRKTAAKVLGQIQG